MNLRILGLVFCNKKSPKNAGLFQRLTGHLKTIFLPLAEAVFFI